MNTIQQQKAARDFANRWAGRGYEKGDSQIFWIELLSQVFGVQTPSEYLHFEQQVKLDHTSFIDAYIPSTHVMIEQKSIEKNLGDGIKQSDGSILNPFQQAKRYAAELPYSQRPRWIVTCNFAQFWVYDMEQPNGEPQKILLKDLEKEYYRLQFLVDEGNEHLKREMEVSVKAGNLVGVIYDKLLEQYSLGTRTSPSASQAAILRSLNILCVRLVFCLYAEDAGLFNSRTSFHDYLNAYPAQKLRRALVDLFAVLDTPLAERDKYLEDDLAAFPYVNGGLFSDKTMEIPPFTDELKQLLLEDASADFDWSEISPTIFGAVFESTLNPETRRSGGMHYTSIENIHKVIDPLFMDDLHAEFVDILGARSSSPATTQGMRTGTSALQRQRLAAFQDKLASLTFFDPACGSGNFLTETYLSLRKLENEVIQAMYGGANILTFDTLIKVHIGQFYGIEINDFACTVAKTALWIAENQMMQQTSAIAGKAMDFLPLKTNANIVEGNALRLDWALLGARSSSPATTGTRGLSPAISMSNNTPIAPFTYIFGNPPFCGRRYRSLEQMEDVATFFDYKDIDYVACWYKKAAMLIQNTDTKCCFVSTNSITQGEQVTALWKELKEKYHIQIDFAYRTFRWDSEADIKAHVHCVIIGFSLGAAVAKRSSPAKTGSNEILNEIKNHTRGYLPHFESQRFQTITLRLYDSVPRDVIEQWKCELGIPLGARTSPSAISNTQSNNADEDVRAPREQQLRQLIDQYEDAGIGQCFFKDDRIAQIVKDALYYYNGKRYNLIRWCIMPNHVHILIEIIGEWSVATILKDWKSYTAHEANNVLGRKGDFWMAEYFDRYIRNIDHYRNAIDYIDNNPVKAGLVAEPQQWKWCSAGYDAGRFVAGGDRQAYRAPRIYFSDNQIITAANINGYLMDAPDVFITNRSTPICDVPRMQNGNVPLDGDALKIEAEDLHLFEGVPYIKRLMGGKELLHNELRYVLWLVGVSPAEIKKYPQVYKRVEQCRLNRLAMKDKSTQKLADTPATFRDINNPDNYIALPMVSSERRRYIPMAYLHSDVIPTNQIQTIPNASLYHFGVLTSNVHMAWMRVVCGRLKSDYRYSKDIVYNNFPWPNIADGDVRVPSTAQAILDARAKYPDSSLADLYDEVTMPPELRRAHQENDRAVMAAYGFSTKMTESECVAELFKMYQSLTK